MKKLARGGVIRQFLEARVLAFAVGIVADNRKAQVLKMHANLVSAPGVQNGFDQRSTMQSLDHPITRPSLATGTFGNCHALSMARMSRHRSPNIAALARNFAAEDGAINFLQRAAGELLGQS